MIVFDQAATTGASPILVAFIADRAAAHAFEVYWTLTNRVPDVRLVGYGTELPPFGLLEEARVRVVFDP